MTDTYNKGDEVEWSWGPSSAKGTVVETYKERVTKTLKGSEITRNADDGNPAYLIEQDDGDQVLKSHSELDSA